MYSETKRFKDQNSKEQFQLPVTSDLFLFNNLCNVNILEHQRK